MKKLQRDCPLNFFKLPWHAFASKESFEQECCFTIPLESNFSFRNNKKNIWHQKTFNSLKINAKLNFSLKKMLFFFHFYINTVFVEIKCESLENIKFHLIGLFLVLIELEKFFVSDIKPSLIFDSNKIDEKRYYLDIKRRIFNVFYYFAMSPQTLSFFIESLLHFIIFNKNFEFSLTPLELEVVFNDLKTHKKQLLLEFNRQFHYMYQKNSAIFFKEDPRTKVPHELSLDYLNGLTTKNKYKLRLFFQTHKSILVKKKLLLVKIEKSLSKQKITKNRILKKENIFYYNKTLL